jgi:hypothetical protein
VLSLAEGSTVGTAIGMREELQKRAMAKSHAQHHTIFGRENIVRGFGQEKRKNPFKNQ